MVWIAHLVAVALAMAVTALMAFRLRKIALVDAGWGMAFVAAAVAVTAATDTHDARTWLLLGMVLIWGLRLSWHLGRRAVASDHDDPRYIEMLGGRVGEVPALRIVTKVFVLQGLIIAAIATPVTLGLAHPLRVWWPVWLGIWLWAVGVFFEAVGDAQLARYRARTDRPPMLDTGLWAWTRHPNYFGDACVWWGLWLAGAAADGLVPAAATVIAPVAMTYFLTAVSGVRLTEKRMSGRPGWDAYAARTSVFLPRPPRRG
jgi:steroid 5-alpha reductase family enzyme